VSADVPAPGLRTMRALGTDATVAVTRPAVLDAAARMLRDELVAIDRACSRFRPDAELWKLDGTHGSPVVVSALLFDALTVACDVARRTEGAVDPTVGAALATIGYDRDFAAIGHGAPGDDAAHRAPVPAPGWWRIELDPRRRTVRVPPGVRLDLGSSAKALVVDRAASRIAGATGAGVLVSVGGDVRVAGPSPEHGWAVGIAADSSANPSDVDQVVAIHAGGLASSSTTVRAWRRGGRRMHHIVDPATGTSAEAIWTLASATASSCVDANAASTAAIVWGDEAPTKLRHLGHPARLVSRTGRVVTVNRWPADRRRGARATTQAGLA